MPNYTGDETGDCEQKCAIMNEKQNMARGLPWPAGLQRRRRECRHRPTQSGRPPHRLPGACPRGSRASRSSPQSWKPLPTRALPGSPRRWPTIQSCILWHPSFARCLQVAATSGLLCKIQMSSLLGFLGLMRQESCRCFVARTRLPQDVLDAAKKEKDSKAGYNAVEGSLWKAATPDIAATWRTDATAHEVGQSS